MYFHSEDLRRREAVGVFLFRAAEQKFSGPAFLWRVIFMFGVTVKIQSADNKLIQVRNNLRCLSFKSYMVIKSLCLALSCASQAAQAHLFANFQRNVTCQWHIIMIDFDYAKRDSRLAAYGSVVLQRFEL